MATLKLLSADGKTHVFDQSAGGYVRAEGCAAILLAWYDVSTIIESRQTFIFCSSDKQILTDLSY